MTNEEKAKEIAEKTHTVWRDEEDENISSQDDCYEAAMAMADFKNSQPISELGGWHTEPPTEDDCYLVEATTIPYKNSSFLVAEYDTNAKAWYDEAFENPINIIRWKKI